MTDKKPTFFEGRRVEVFFKGGRLFKQKKTDIRFWRLKWAITMFPADARVCGGAIESNYEHLQARQNAAEKIEVAGMVPGVVVTVWPTSEGDDSPVLRLAGCDLDKFAMTWADGMTEFWLHVEHPLTDALHTFVRDHAFQRFYVQFERQQMALGDAAEGSLKDIPLEEIADRAADDFQKLCDESDASLQLRRGGKTVAEFKPRGAKPN